MFGLKSMAKCGSETVEITYRTQASNMQANSVTDEGQNEARQVPWPSGMTKLTNGKGQPTVERTAERGTRQTKLYELTNLNA